MNRLPNAPLFLAMLGLVVTYTKKAWGTYQLLVPQSEAFAMPTQSETNNAEAHACMYDSPDINEFKAMMTLNPLTREDKTYPVRHLPLHCSLTELLKVAKFQIVKNKASSKRFSKITYDPPAIPSGLLRTDI